MVTVLSDNKDIKENIDALIKGVQETGGGTHSRIIIAEQDGNLSVHVPEDIAEGRELMRIKRKALVSSDLYNLELSGNEFKLSFPENCLLNPIQKRLIEAKINLYNLTNKVELHKKESLFFALRKHPDVTDKILVSRNLPESLQKNIDKIRKGATEEEEKKVMVEMFLKTRHLGYLDPLRITNVSVIMPIIDFMNHNWNGAGYGKAIGANQGDIYISSALPIKNSNECYAYYGPMDAMDTLIRYDFVDHYAPVIKSVPLEFELTNGFKLSIKSGFTAPQKNIDKSIKDLARYAPQITTDQDTKTLTLSHLFIPTEGALNSMERILMYAIGKADGSSNLKEMKTTVRNIRDAIIEKNKSYYKDLGALVDSKEPKEDTKILNTVKTLASLQKNKLNEIETKIKQSDD